MPSRLAFAATFAFVVAGASEARAFEVKHSAEGELVRWKRANVTWAVDRSVRAVAGAESAIATAVDAWTERGGAPALEAGGADGSLEPGFDGKNAIFYAGEGFEPAGDALAVTLLSFDDRTGEVLDADIVLNGKYHLAPIAAVEARPSFAGVPEAATYDVRRVVAHEMGHALGLSDEPREEDALMYPYVPRARALPTSPNVDDLAGLTELYGAVKASSLASASEAGSNEGPDAAGCTGAVVARAGSHGASGPTLAAAGLVLAAIVIARGRRRGAAACTVMAAASLVVLPPAEPDAKPRTSTYDAHAVVTRVSTTSLRGVFRSEVELARGSCASGECALRAAVWGGTIGGVRQVIGGLPVPSKGDHVGVMLEPDRRAVRAMTRILE
jgi:hypothetical protein